jgi:hypothetical protein
LRDDEDSGDSWMDVGFYDEDAMDNSDDLVWIDSVYDTKWDDFWWQNYMTALRFREQTSSSVTYTESVDAADEIAIDAY